MDLTSSIDDYAPLIGRVIMGYIFLSSAINKALTFSYTVEQVSANAPYPVAFTILAIVIGVIFGVGLITGFKTKASATVLLLFTAIIAFFFHTAADEQGLFTQDLIIMAGLLYMMTFGSGQFAADTKVKKKANLR